MISLGGIVSLASLRVGGDDLDRDIAEWVRHAADAVITAATAEALKMSIGTASPTPRPRTAEVPARRTSDGAPFALTMSGDDVHAAIADHVHQIVRASSECLSGAPPDLAQDVLSTASTSSAAARCSTGCSIGSQRRPRCRCTRATRRPRPSSSAQAAASRTSGRLSQLFASAER